MGAVRKDVLLILFIISIAQVGAKPAVCHAAKNITNIKTV